MSNPTNFQEVINDPRYGNLEWNQKKVVLSRFSERNPSPVAPLAAELERLKHFSEGNTPQVNKLNQDMFRARREWADKIAAEEDPAQVNWSSRLINGGTTAADQEFKSRQKLATEAYQQSLSGRQEDLNLASSLSFLEDQLEVSAGNISLDVLDAINPINYISSFVTGDFSARDKAFGKNRDQLKEVLDKLKGKGYSSEDIEVLKRDASIASGNTGGSSVAVDSQGNIGINDAALVKDIDAVREQLESIDAPSSIKRQEIRSLEQSQRDVVDRTFLRIASTGGLTWDTNDDGTNSNPRLNPQSLITNLATEGFSAAGDLVGLNTDTTERVSGAGAASGDLRNISMGRKIDVLSVESELGFTFEDRKKAVENLIDEREGILDRTSIGLGQGLGSDLVNMILTPFELAGSDSAKKITKGFSEQNRAFSSADALADIGTMDQMAELVGRVGPQIAITRGAGSLAGAAKATNAAQQVARARTAQALMLGYGGATSATFNARDVIDNGGSTAEAVAAGMLGFGTTFLISSGFNAAGRGGVEQYRSKMQASAEQAKRELKAKMLVASAKDQGGKAEVIVKGVSRGQNVIKGTLDEGVEEFIDEYINGLITQDFTNATPEELATNAFKGALVGGFFGGVVGSTQPTIDDIRIDSSTEDVSSAANKEMELLEESPKKSQRDRARRRVAAQIQELREKSSQNTTTLSDGTEVEVGLTEEEELLLESLEEQLANDDFGEIPVVEGSQRAESTRQQQEEPPTEETGVDEDTANDLNQELDEELNQTAPVAEVAPAQQKTTVEVAAEPVQVPAVEGDTVEVDGYRGKLVDDEGRLAIELEGGSLLELSDEQLLSAQKINVPVEFGINSDGSVTLDGNSDYNYKTTNLDSSGNMESVTVVDSSGQEIDLVGDEAIAVVIDQSKDKGFFSLNRASTRPRVTAPVIKESATKTIGPAIYQGLDSAVTTAIDIKEGKQVSFSDLVTAKTTVANRIHEVFERTKTKDYDNAEEVLQKLFDIHAVSEEEVRRRINLTKASIWRRLFPDEEVTEEEQSVPFVSAKKKVEVYEKAMEEEEADFTQEEEDAIVDDYAEAAVEEEVIEENPTKQIREVPIRRATSVRLQTELDAARDANEDLMENSKASGVYGKSGIPRKFFTEEPTEEMVDEFSDWVGKKEEALNDYSDSPSVNVEEENIRQEQIDVALELIDAYQEYLADVRGNENFDEDTDEDDNIESATYYGGLFFLNPEVIIPAIKTVFKESKNFLQFSKKMLRQVGSVIKNSLRTLWSNLTSNGEVTPKESAPPESTQEIPLEKRGPQIFAEDQAQVDTALDEELGRNDPSPENYARSYIRIPKLLSAGVIDRLARMKTGSQNTLIPGLGKAVQYLSLGITKQVHNDVVGSFFETPILSWLFGRESATRRGAYIASQFDDKYRNTIKTDKRNNFLSENIKPKEEGLSLRPSDVVEDVMEHGRKNYDVSDDFLRFVADWRYTLNMILRDARAEGIDLNFLKNDDGKYDYSKILNNFYFPRGQVTLAKSGDSGARGAAGGKPRTKVKSFSNERKIETEQEGITSEKYLYDESPADRINSFIQDVYGRIEDKRLANHPDIVKATRAPKSRKTEDGKRRKVQRLGDRTINIPGSRTYSSGGADADLLNAILEGRSVSSDSALVKASKIAQGMRALKFTFDFSAAGIQLAFLWGFNPIRGSKAAFLAFANTFGGRSLLLDYKRKNRDFIAERISLGGLYDFFFEDIQFLRDTDTTSTRARQLLSKALSPFTNFYAVAIEVAANEMYAALRYQAVDKKTGRLDPIKAEKIVRFTDRAVGRESLTRNGLKASNRAILSMISSAPSMYSGYINMIADVISKDKFTREQAWKAHARFLGGMSVLFVAKSFAAMMMDDEDKRTDEQKLQDAFSRLNPASRKFMVTEVPLGGGRRAVFSEGGFFRGAYQLLARMTTDPANSGEAVAKFLKSKKSPGIGTALEIMTNKDYFGNDITTLESLAEAYLPITLNEAAQEYRGPVIDFVAETLTAVTPWNFKGQSTTSRLAEGRDWDQTLEQVIFNAVGLSAYTESSRGQFNRRIDNMSSVMFDGRKYRELSLGEKRDVIREAKEKDILKPKFKTVDDYGQFQIDKLKSNLSDPDVEGEVTLRGIYGKMAAIPQYQVAVGGTKVHIDSQDHKEMYAKWTKNLSEFVDNEDVSQMSDEKFLQQSELLWETQLRENGY